MNKELKRIYFSSLGLIVAVILALIFLSSCILTTDRMNAAKELSPEQITALDQAGHAVITCLIVGGPPVGGRTLFLIIPKDRLASIKLSPDCQLQSGEIGLATGILK